MRPHRSHRRRLRHPRGSSKTIAPQFVRLKVRFHVKIIESAKITSQQEIILPITIQIPGALREFTAGRARVEISLARGTVADALTALWTLHPGVRDRVVNEQGQVRQHINIFLGNENIRYTGGLATPIGDGLEIAIVPAVSGG
jgi:sulfur-carrier protein